MTRWQATLHVLKTDRLVQFLATGTVVFGTIICDLLLKGFHAIR